MDDVLGKAQRLLALTTSSNIDEARNAALALARIIRAHGIVLSLPPEGRGTTFPTPNVPKPPGVQVKVKVPRRPYTPPINVDDWQKIKAKFAGYCKGCGKGIKQNTPIYWSREKGAYHPVCFINAK